MWDSAADPETEKEHLRKTSEIHVRYNDSIVPELIAWF